MKQPQPIDPNKAFIACPFRLQVALAALGSALEVTRGQPERAAQIALDTADALITQYNSDKPAAPVPTGTFFTQQQLESAIRQFMIEESGKVEEGNITAAAKHLWSILNELK